MCERIANPLRTLIGLLVSAIMLSAFTGCTTTTGLAQPERPDAFALQAKVFRPGNRVTLYRVQPDGTISFGGGMNALHDETTWSGALTEDEMTQLRSVLEQHDWFRTPPPRGDGPEDDRAIVSLRRMRYQQKFTVYGDNDLVDRMLQVLERASRRRHDSYLKRLPEPGPQNE